ncbi:unnamed protein product [Cylicocyclus nassatus]|uniref:Uncharacterized protein n=1 Tax=Cylicocyclus nassatus TaxID=53992 RepID=A0AA36DV49_CYLNA|nr:unnamed protein product [Cylicocyclus nassatus]
MSKIVIVFLLFAILIADNSAREIQRTKRQPQGGQTGQRPEDDIDSRDRMIQILPPRRGPMVAQTRAGGAR